MNFCEFFRENKKYNDNDDGFSQKPLKLWEKKLKFNLQTTQ